MFYVLRRFGWGGDGVFGEGVVGDRIVYKEFDCVVDFVFWENEYYE